MPTLQVSLWGPYLAAASTIGATWLYFTFKEPENGQRRRYPKTSLFLLAHTLYLLYYILVSKPENMFETFKLPVNTAEDVLRALLIQNSETGSVDSRLELLLKRLGSFDMRLLYVRFGHNAIAQCEWCSSFEDFALYSLPAVLLGYLREAGVIGMLTLNSSERGYLRPLGIGSLVIACLTELYWIVTSPISVDTDLPTWMLHDQLLRYRHLLFLLLPLIIYKLPTVQVPIPILSNILSPPVSLTPEQKQDHYTTTLRTLEHLIPALHLAKYTKASIMRTPELRETAIKWWDEEEKEGKWMLGDEDLKKTAKMSGLGYGHGSSGRSEDDEPLRNSAGVAVRSLQQGAVPSEHWRL
ncbi:hypothetical protein AGABI1DRAFT_78621 [Agaricus bisporus var. burnettii JB137-S8]|uniref:Uncharacterized protein n=1 Tax=Agaricus bisporus var. burnettii (strain JB137-S8 / ATCC MYA-4627 / FGSC 10392) TaxID=597362 RepID=K5X060_AGABU|nr:uncharacterized protein AGABI1DRAFT_78621 [Agaricus bisporus var. burnettii JB137-S8]EKM76498.1 hypothetical protein AGABI1DRAFT_78621 [Agaricus bisporus var. burnettii JB137-S8]